MKLCVVGNSHAFALKAALDSNHKFGNNSVDFYAIVGRDQPKFKLESGCLIPVSPDKVFMNSAAASKSALDVAHYDSLVISACGWFALRNQFIAADPDSHPLGRFCCVDWIGRDLDRPSGATQLVSAAVFGAVVEAYVRNHASIKLAFLLSAHFPGSIWLQPWPAPNRALKSDTEWFINARYGLLGPRAWSAFFKAQRRALEAVAKELGPRFTLLDYPLPASSDDGFMDGHWCEPRDYWHGNAKYGGLVLDQIMDEGAEFSSKDQF